jgi:hypothetical protein
LVAGTLLAGSFWIPAGLEPATVSRAREASA